MNWAEIRKLFLRSVGETTGAAEEWSIHVTEGYRRTCSRLNVRELETTVDKDTSDGIDYILLPTDVYHVIEVVNLTSGWPLVPEEAGVRSRSRYFEADESKPAEGEPTNYVLTGEKMFLRPTPDDTYTLRLRYRIQVPQVGMADMASEPIIPEQYHMAIVHASALSYLRTHLDADQVDPGAQSPSMRAEQAFQAALVEPDLPKDRERFDQRGRMYLKGFRLGR